MRYITTDQHVIHSRLKYWNTENTSHSHLDNHMKISFHTISAKHQDDYKKNTCKVQNIQVVVQIIVLFSWLLLWLLLWTLTHQSRSMSSSKTNRPAVIATAMTQISTFFDPGFRRSVFTVVIICSGENRQKVTCHTTAWSVILKSLLNWHSTKPCAHFFLSFLGGRIAFDRQELLLYKKRLKNACKLIIG